MTESLSIEDRILRLEALVSPRLVGTQLSRVLRENAPGLSWCLALGVMGCPKNFYYGATMEAAVKAAEDDLLTPVVPDEQMCILLHRDPKTVFYKGPGIPAKLDMTGIDLSKYKGRRLRSGGEPICLLVS